MVRTITALKHLLACASLCVGAMQAFAQPDIEDVLVEVYYVSDNNDATDETGGFLAPGSRTYRVFIDLCTGCSMRALYGDSAHPLLIRSTAPFFNNIDRGRTYGHQIANGEAPAHQWGHHVHVPARRTVVLPAGRQQHEREQEGGNPPGGAYVMHEVRAQIKVGQASVMLTMCGDR